MRDLFDLKPHTRSGFEPRDYQTAAHDGCFRHWDAGTVGALVRSATGTGKTVIASLVMDTWLRRGPEHRCMVVSYETQLVWQFAQEIEDILGIKPGIEMDGEKVKPGRIPKITVVSRASLLRAKPPTAEQLAELMSFGVCDPGPSPERVVKRFLRHLRNGGDPEVVRQEISRLGEQAEADGKHWSRVHKFDWRYHWLLVFDEAHRHAYHLASVGPVVDWFDRNPASRRLGITATPKRGDNVSIGDKMFPAVALDYPLYSPNKPCAVKDGWAVPYVQTYIEVEGVDFKSLSKIGDDFDEAELERKLGEEKTLAQLVGPTLDKVGQRRTLIFSPGVEMAKNVARFINARAETKCAGCGKVAWHPRLLIGDGAECSCGRLMEPGDVTRDGEQARQLDGSSPEHERKKTYQEHQAGRFQFLSVCGLCREGYNDPDIACVAVFRPVSKKCASLAEQMKGRGCRPLRGLVNGLTDREDRLAAIAGSAKPNCLIVDLVGITGLPDCATTASVFADGLADCLEEEGHDEQEAAELAAEIAKRAEEILLERGLEEEVSVEEVIAQAKRESEEAREKVKREREAAEKRAREEAERRAKAGAEVTYSEHQVGYGQSGDPLEASEGQYKFAAFLGMEVRAARTKRQMIKLITLLKKRLAPAEVARACGLDDQQWELRRPSLKQLNFMWAKGVPADRAKCPRDASLLLDAKLKPETFMEDCRGELGKARNDDELDGIAKDVTLVRGVLPEGLFAELIAAGKRRREELHEIDPFGGDE